MMKFKHKLSSDIRNLVLAKSQFCLKEFKKEGIEADDSHKEERKEPRKVLRKEPRKELRKATEADKELKQSNRSLKKQIREKMKKNKFSEARKLAKQLKKEPRKEIKKELTKEPTNESTNEPTKEPTKELRKATEADKERKRLKCKLKKQMQREAREKSKMKDSSEAKKLAINYLHMWNSARDMWSFKKKQQYWLLDNIYDADNISEDNFKILLDYVFGLQGAAKNRLIEKSEEIIKKLEGGSTSADGSILFERARTILQHLV